MDLIIQFEQLRISDSDFFGQSLEIQREYERANNILDECLEIVVKWMEKKKLEFEII